MTRRSQKPSINAFGLMLLISGTLWLPIAPGQTCHSEYAQNVVSSSLGANANANAADPIAVLGNTPNTRFSLGENGNVVVSYSGVFSTSGDGAADICIDELNDNDCYFPCLKTNDATTLAAIQSAGWQAINGFYEVPGSTFCGNLSIDLDALLVGFAAGDLSFDCLMIVDDGSSGDGAEIERIEAKFVCTPAPPGACVAGYASGLVSHDTGTNGGGDPLSVLGDTNSFFTLGDDGKVIVSFAGNFSTSGDGRFDICVDEIGSPDCYWICIKPADQTTLDALNAAGVNIQSNGYFEVTGQPCGDFSFDLDSLIPGYTAGELQFDCFMVLDDGDDNPSSNGAEIARIEAKFVCPSPPPGNCLPENASVLVSHQAGAGSGGDPLSVLGNTNDVFSLGDDGQVVVGFSGDFSTSGDARFDICVDEQGSPDCYWVCIKPANQATIDALSAAGVSIQSNGYFEVSGQPWCGDLFFDLDSVIPGHAEGELRFDYFMVLDDGDENPSSDGAEIRRIEAKFVCCASDYANTLLSQSGNDALGAEDGLCFSPDGSNPLIVAFSATFSTDANTVRDLRIIETGGADYVVCLQPADAATETALQNAGLTQDGAYYELGIFNGDADIDVDAIVAGFGTVGEADFNSIQIKQSNGSTPCIDAAFADAICGESAPDDVLAKIGDFVWLDDDRNGTQDGMDTAVPDVLVLLLDAAGNYAGQSTTTDSDGLYSFCVKPGTYRVRFVKPSGFAWTEQNSGNNNSDSDADPSDGLTETVTVGPKEMNWSLDAGLVSECDENSFFKIQAFRNKNGVVECGKYVPIGEQVCLSYDLPEPGMSAVTFFSADGVGSTPVPLFGIIPLATPFAIVMVQNFGPAEFGGEFCGCDIPCVPGLAGVEGTVATLAFNSAFTTLLVSDAIGIEITDTLGPTASDALVVLGNLELCDSLDVSGIGTDPLGHSNSGSAWIGGNLGSDANSTLRIGFGNNADPSRVDLIVGGEMSANDLVLETGSGIHDKTATVTNLSTPGGGVFERAGSQPCSLCVLDLGQLTSIPGVRSFHGLRSMRLTDPGLFPITGIVTTNASELAFSSSNSLQATFSVTGAQLAAADTYTFNILPSASVLVNVVGPGSFPPNASFNITNNRNLVWNFFGASSLNFSGAVEGTVLAPCAHINLDGAQMTNGLIAGSIKVDGASRIGDDGVFGGCLAYSFGINN